ncbi:amino acid permease [archaeon]|jgi:basic amino acid/polyamine antiporter, APA family|nr:amino acid permease [archaeon]MBT3451197.1 amino acid permease [archaeon]MBT6869015.1 amino acid permease [archaeon]MBT7193603.1 amino acid permease [archaeon]MBT7380136.1 amino acid permease [archaeon]
MAELKKVLGFKTILLITINSIMGTGIFFLPAVGAGKSGPASLISWAILSVVSIYIAMCFGELSSMFPKSGGIYEFCKQAYGRFFSFLIGWMTIIAGNVTIAMLVVGAIQYLMPVGSIWLKIGASLIFIFVFNYIAFKGMQTSAVMLIAFSIITLFTVISLIIPGLIKFNVSNFTPFFVFPVSSIALTIFLVAETFFGWETATFLAEETKDGQKVMPKALIYGTIIIAVICLLSVISSMSAINWQIFGSSSAPLADLAVEHFGPQSSGVYTILVYLAIIGSVAGWIVSAPRLLLAMAEDKLFPAQFAKIHPKNGTPYLAIIFQTVLSTILVIVGAGSYTTLLELLLPIVLIMYSFVLISVVVLRYKKPNLKRYYTAPFGKVGPILVTLFIFFLIGMWLHESHGAFDLLSIAVSLLILGIPVYFLIEMYYDSEAIRKVNEKLPYLLLFSENFLFPLDVRRKIFLMVGNLKGKKVLEFGCGVGTLTRRLANKVLPGGKIYAFDFAKHNVNLVSKNMKKNNHNHVSVFHHEYLDHFKTKNKFPKCDILISTGTFSYVQNPEKVVKHLSNNLRKGARIVIMDYDNFFHLMPNVEWISDHKRLNQMFTQAGFKIEIIRKRSLLWTHIFIVGEKK